MPLWEAWFARHSKGYESEALIKILAMDFKDPSFWEELRPPSSRLLDNKFSQMLEDEEERSIEVAHKMHQAAMTMKAELDKKSKAAK